MYKYIKPRNKIYIDMLSLVGLLYLLIIIFLLNFTIINLYNIQQLVGISCTIIKILVNV